MLPKIQVYKGWDPKSEPTLVPYDETNKFEEIAGSIIKLLKLEGISIDDLQLSADNPSIAELDKTKTLQEHGITPSSRFYANVSNPELIPRKIIEEEIEEVQYTPLFHLIDSELKGSSPQDYNTKQKYIILYGLAAALYDIHKSDDIKINISPKYIFVDNQLHTIINREMLKSDSKTPKDFIFVNAKYKQFLPEEVVEQGYPSDDSEARMKGDVFSFGSICYSMFNITFDFNIEEERTKDPELNDVPISVQNLIKSCWNRNISERPSFTDILHIISQQDFIEEVGIVDIEEFKQYQSTVVDKQFIQDLDLNFIFDLTRIPKIQIREKADFNIGKQIGRGGFGQVFLATDKKNQQKVAYKELIFDPKQDLVISQRRTYREIEILATTNNCAVQKLYGVIIGNDEAEEPTIIMTPYEANGGLDKLLTTKKKIESFDITQKYIVMYGIAAGMTYLHKKNIMHRDIKVENILMNDKLEPIITDFGLSKQVQDSNNLFQSMVGTGSILYMAPELLDNGGGENYALYDAKCSDVYAFGILIYYLFTGKRPYSECKVQTAVMSKICKGILPVLPKDFPHTLELLYRACCSLEPSSRPTFEEVLRIIGNPAFIQHTYEDVDLARFEEYKKKVLGDSFVATGQDDGNSQDEALSAILSEIPEDQKRTREEFQVVSDPSKDNHPFFITARVSDSRNNGQYDYIKLKKEFFEEEEFVKHLSTMIQSMYELNHPAINHPYAYISGSSQATFKEDAYSIFEIFPRAAKGSPYVLFPSMNDNLKDCITSMKDLSMTQKFIILYGIAAGMYHMHQNRFAHLNLNPKNILLNDQLQPIINLDITSRPKSCKENLFYLLPAFSFPYVAPELLDFKDGQTNTEIDEELSDVYSFAMIAYFLFSGIQPWNNCVGYQSILLKTMKNERPITEDYVPYPFNKLIEDCWYTKPVVRPTFKVILNRIGSSNFIRSIQSLDLQKFQEYQKTVVDEKFIFPIQLYSIRKREEFEITKMIGSGMFGCVRLAIDKTNQNEVAYKEIPPNDQDKNKKLVDREIDILSSMNFPSVISLYGIIKPEGDKKETVVLFPFARNGDLEKLIIKENRNVKSRQWTFTQKCIVMYGIAMGMYKLHQKDIIHRDLKPQNILINQDFEPWITDFELSKFVDANQTMFQSMTVGTPAYMAPEAFNDEKDENGNVQYDGKLADIYSFGVLVYFLMTGMQPWSNVKNQFTLMNKIIKGDRPAIPEVISDSFKSLIEACWHNDPLQRPSFKEIVEIISQPDFYKNSKHNFNDFQFYKYQVKLGELDFIKYSNEEIIQFNEKSEGPVSIGRELIHSIKPSPATNVYHMAQQGKPDSQYLYGCMLRDGKDMPKDINEAVVYFKRASDQGHLDAMVSYAACLKEGTGVKKDEAEALRLMNIAAEKDNVEAQVMLAGWYSKDRPRKYGLAYDLLKKAEKQHSDAPAMIGSLMEKRKLGATPNQEEIMLLYKTSCERASPEGMYHMATFYHRGNSVVAENKTEAARLYALAAKNQNANQGAAVLLLSILYEEMGEYEKAFSNADFYRSQDMFEGYVRCSDLYRNGIGVEKNEAKADEYLKIACEPRFAKGQMTTGLLYSRGKGVKRDKAKAFYWTEIAAKNGSPQGQANLCGYYIDGYGCEADIEKAEEFGLKSAEQGNDHGMFSLAKVYKKKKDPANEFKYIEMAAKLGNEKALVELGKKYKEKQQNEEAIKCFKEAAESRIPFGLFLYGKELLSGKYTSQNKEEGIANIEDAAKMGCKDAYRKLISIYTNGEYDIPKDSEKASKFQEALNKMPKHSK